MPIDISITQSDGFLLVEARGEWTIEDAAAGITKIAQQSRDLGQSKILLDLRTLSAPPSDFARFLAGDAIANRFPAPNKVAAVRPPDLLDKFAENTAVNRGANAIVVSDFEQARQWLLET